jgi:hypothetical protein
LEVVSRDDVQKSLRCIQVAPCKEMGVAFLVPGWVVAIVVPHPDLFHRFDALVDLFESFAHFLNQLGMRSDVSFRAGSKVIVVEIMVELLKTLARATQMMKQNRLSEHFTHGLSTSPKPPFAEHFVKVLIEGDEMKAVHDRLEKLMRVEHRMMTVETFSGVHQGKHFGLPTLHG